MFFFRINKCMYYKVKVYDCLIVIIMYGENFRVSCF